MSRIAKPCTLFSTMTTNPADHIRYLVDGHGLAGNEPILWTKGITKEGRTLGRIDKYWDKIHDLWQEHTPNQAKMTGKQVFVALPNDITTDEIAQVAKAILRTVPQHHPATLTVHYTSGKNNKQNVHLHGIISMRRGGYGATNDEYRLNSRLLAKAAVDSTLKKCGYTIQNNPEKVQVKTRPSRNFVRWMRATWPEDKLRNPAFLRRVVLPEAQGHKAQKWLQQEIRKAEFKQQPTDFEDARNFGKSVRLFQHRYQVPQVHLSDKILLPKSVLQKLKQKAVPAQGQHECLDYLNLCQQVSRKPPTFQQLKAAEAIRELTSSDDNLSKFGDVGAELAGGKIVSNIQKTTQSLAITPHEGASRPNITRANQINKLIQRQK